MRGIPSRWISRNGAWLHAAAFIAAFGLATAPLACEFAAGRLVSAQAVVELRPAGSDAWMRIEPPRELCEGDQVAVRSPGRAAIVLSNDVLLRLDQQTTLHLTRVAPEADSQLGLSEGIVHVITRFRKRFELITPFVNALVEGTEFTVASGPDGAQVVVAEGVVRARNALGEQGLGAGDAIEAGRGSAPASIAVRPLDAVRWAIHYPQIVWLDSAALAALPAASRSTVAAAQQAMAAARYGEALARLDTLAADPPVVQIEALRASVLLALGRVDQARERLDRFAERNDAALGALDAVIRVARNDPDGALGAAQQALATDAASAAGQLALSYATQARRDVPQALEAAREATRLAPDNPFAWARRAELELSLAQIANGRTSAERALGLAAAVPRARALLGFAQLLEGDAAIALDSFATARAADPADPLAHFGSGLAHVRAGDLPRGRREIEIAVLLDPANAELRSYLGRVYVEEDRSALGGEQFALARRLDPASPTPWYFDAFRKLRDNDPLGAIADGRRAVELNDNRAVLRSSELLDSDRSARSASLGAAYGEIGFEQAMLAAGMKALEDDAIGPAGHRLLAEAYAQTPRFETARLSELLQAQLRQPLGQAPIPPQLQSRNLPIVQGPRALAPEEATALFERRPSHFAASVLGGSDHTWGDSLVGAHSSDRAQVSAGHFDYRRDGLGERADTDLSGTRLTAQYAATPSTMLYAELGHEERSGGDIAPRLLDGVGMAWDQRIEQDLRSDRGRLSLRYTPEPDREYIFTAGAQSARERTVDRLSRALAGFDFDLDFDVRTRLHTRDLGVFHGAKGEHYDLAAGFGSYREARSQGSETRVVFAGFPLPSAPDPTTRGRVEHHTAFAYLHLRPAPLATLHLGASYADLNAGAATSVERVNAKAGVTLKLAPATALRLAALQGVKGPKYQDQTLEPTQFAGFNQVFDDLDGTRWRRTAAGFDHRFDNGIMTGLEWSTRELEVPGLGCSPGDCRADWSERLHRAYVAMPLGRRAALSAEWQYERLSLDGDPATLQNLPFRTRTEQLPLGLWLKLAPRLSTRLEAVRVRQHSAIADAGDTASRATRFWLANARLSYAEPGRRTAVSLSVHNAFDRRFAFQDTDLNGNPKIPLFFPRRTVLLQLNLRF